VHKAAGAAEKAEAGSSTGPHEKKPPLAQNEFSE